MTVKNKVFLLFIVALTSGCSSLPDWFSDDDEIEAKTLEPLQSQFTPRIVWDTEIGDGVGQFYSNLSPAFAYGKVFAADRSGYIYALEPTTGDVVWKKDVAPLAKESKLSNLYGMFPARLSSKISGGLTTAYETVYFGTENGEVFALEESTGELKWRSQVAGEVVAPPAVDAGIVVVNTVAGVLAGLDAESGEIKWTNESDVPPLSLRGISSPTAANGGAIVGTATGKLKVSIIDSGLTAWEQLIAKPSGATELERMVDIDSRPVVFGGYVYVVSFGGTLAAVELRSGQVVWNREYAAYRDITIQGNRIFVTDNKGVLYALDRRNGIELWSNATLRRRGLTAPAVVGAHLLVGDKYGYVHYFDQEQGRYLSRISLGNDSETDGIFASPVKIDADVLVYTRDGELFRVSAN